MEKNITLFSDKENCSACSACVNACPLGAIIMKADKAGFYYPEINRDICISCGKCLTACSFTQNGINCKDSPKVYAASDNDSKLKSLSASGGLFARLALYVLSQGGHVFGAAWDNDYIVKHIEITKADELSRLQGSKYVQSYVGDSFKRTKELLEEGKAVLFSGTPCQISGLYSYLTKDHEKLYTADLICHGVPNSKLLSDDIKHTLRSNNLPDEGAKITFRDKTKGWGKHGAIEASNGKLLAFDPIHSPYYYYFDEGTICRPSCCNCRFPSEHRVGDITLGDYWGIEGAHPEALKQIKTNEGVSCLLVNSEKGKMLLSSISCDITCISSDIEKAKKRNGRLSHCSKKSEKRECLIEMYENEGYPALAAYFKANEKKSIRSMKIKKLIPTGIKNFLKKLR